MPRAKVKFEEISRDTGSSFRILLTPNLNDVFYWHFHPEYELVFVEGASGTRHIGDHISRYVDGDLVFIGPNIPHLNFDYGVKSTCETIVVQLKEDFLGKEFLLVPEIARIKQLFEDSKYGLSFDEETKRIVGKRLRNLTCLTGFEQLIELLQIFQLLSVSRRQILNSRHIANESIGKDQKRIEKIYHYVEVNFQEKPDVNDLARQCNLSTAAFCRYFRKVTGMTFTDFVNQYRITQAKKLLLQKQSVTTACLDSGFNNLSYFNKTFKKLTGENPSEFRKRELALLT